MLCGDKLRHEKWQAMRIPLDIRVTCKPCSLSVAPLLNMLCFQLDKQGAWRLHVTP